MLVCTLEESLSVLKNQQNYLSLYLYSDRSWKWAWFIPEVRLNQANVVFLKPIFIGNAIFMPSKHSIDLIFAHY